MGDASRLALGSLTGSVIECALRVHTRLGPGLLESAYKVCLLHELRAAQFDVAAEVPLPIQYDRIRLEVGYRVDLLIERQLVSK